MARRSLYYTLPFNLCKYVPLKQQPLLWNIFFFIINHKSINRRTSFCVYLQISKLRTTRFLINWAWNMCASLKDICRYRNRLEVKEQIIWYSPYTMFPSSRTHTCNTQIMAISTSTRAPNNSTKEHTQKKNS